jgi:hypothetical protein
MVVGLAVTAEVPAAGPVEIKDVVSNTTTRDR